MKLTERLETNGLYGSYMAYGPYKRSRNNNDPRQYRIILRPPVAYETTIARGFFDYLMEMKLGRLLLPSERVRLRDPNFDRSRTVTADDLEIYSGHSCRKTHFKILFLEEKARICPVCGFVVGEANVFFSHPVSMHRECVEAYHRQRRIFAKVSRITRAEDSEAESNGAADGIMDIKAVLYMITPVRKSIVRFKKLKPEAYEAAYAACEQSQTQPTKYLGYVTFKLSINVTTQTIIKTARRQLGIAESNARVRKTNEVIFREQEINPTNILLSHGGDGTVHNMCLRIWW